MELTQCHIHWPVQVTKDSPGDQQGKTLLFHDERRIAASHREAAIQKREENCGQFCSLPQGSEGAGKRNSSNFPKGVHLGFLTFEVIACSFLLALHEKWRRQSSLVLESLFSIARFILSLPFEY